MRKILLTFFVSVLSLTYGFAQSEDNSRNLRILYIDHEPSLNSSKLIRYMRQMRREQIEYGHAMIIYMPNGENPFVSLTGIKDYTESGLDTPAAFDKICEALNQPSHDKIPWVDRNRIIKLFDEYNILNDQNRLNFENVRIEFYLTPEYWKLGYNESILAPIYFSLDVPELRKQHFNFDIYVDPENRPQYDTKNPFGLKNYNNINKKLVIDEYTF